MKTKDAESRGAIQLAQGHSAVRGHLWVWVLGGASTGHPLSAFALDHSDMLLPTVNGPRPAALGLYKVSH